MYRAPVTPGADYFDILNSYNRDGTQPTNFLSTDTLTCNLLQGQETVAILNPTVSWNDYLLGVVNFSIAKAQTVLLDPNATYRCQVFATRGSVTVCILDFLVATTVSAGTNTQTVIPYNAYSDMLNYGSWVADVQDVDTDQEGFYGQRLDARNWFDWAVINSYTNNYLGLYGRHSEMAFAFAGGYGMRQSTGPNPTIMGYLASNLLIVRPQVVEVCAHFSLARVGLSQIGLNSSFVKNGYYHQKKAERLATAITAEINTLQGLPGDNGIASIFVNLGATNTLLG